MKSVVQIIVSPQGGISIDAVGFKGADCRKATEYLEQALGVTNTQAHKPEFHQVAAKTNNKQTVG